MDLNAIFAIETMLDVLPFRVELIQHHVCIGLMTGGECEDLVVFRHSLEEANGVGADSDVSLCC